MKRSREVEDEHDTEHEVANPPKYSTIDSLQTAKVAELDPSNTLLEGDIGIDMRCSLPGHTETLSFKSYDEYQSHYQKAHTNRCLECRNNFPSSHLLGVHIEECHDSFMAVKREKGEHTYSCFVEGCERKCRTPEKRRLHLIDKHMFPKNYYFAVSRTGIDGRRSLLIEGRERRRSSTSTLGASKESKRRSSILEGASSQPGVATTRKEGEAKKQTIAEAHSPATDERPDTEMEDLTGAMSALKFIPHSIKFGRGGGKAGFAKR